MTKLEELRVLFCEVDDNRRDLMELKIWSSIEFIKDTDPDCFWDYYKKWEQRVISDMRCECEWDYWENPYYRFFVIWWHSEINNKDSFKELWNPLEERHLRMYCEEQWIILKIYDDGWLITYKDWELYEITILDNTHSLQDQSEETIGKILDFLKDNKWLKQ